jgi:hypothetical protein
MRGRPGAEKGAMAAAILVGVGAMAGLGALEAWYLAR